MQEQLQGVDTGTMPGKSRYYRVKKGIGQLEMGRRIGMADCKAYSRTYENTKRPANNLEGERKICQVLEVEEKTAGAVKEERGEGAGVDGGSGGVMTGSRSCSLLLWNEILNTLKNCCMNDIE